MRSRIILSFAVAACLLGMAPAHSYATPITVQAMGQYHMSDRETRETAIETAKAYAVQRAAEQIIGVAVDSHTIVEQGIVVMDRIKTRTGGQIKIREFSYDFEEKGVLCKVYIVAEIDDAVIKRIADDVEEDQHKVESGIGDQRIGTERREPIKTEPSPQPPLPQPPPPSQPSPLPSPQPSMPSVPLPSPQPAQKVEEVAPGERVPFKGHYYAVIDMTMDWWTAKEYCKSLGGHLAYIKTQEVQTFLENLASTNGRRNSYWLGGTQERGGTRWTWLDGTPIAKFTHWAQGQPDNMEENRLMMYRNTNYLSNNSGLGEWNDIVADGTCNNEDFFGIHNFGFICEWDS